MPLTPEQRREMQAILDEPDDVFEPKNLNATPYGEGDLTEEENQAMEAVSKANPYGVAAKDVARNTLEGLGAVPDLLINALPKVTGVKTGANLGTLGQVIGKAINPKEDYGSWKQERAEYDKEGALLDAAYRGADKLTPDVDLGQYVPNIDPNRLVRGAQMGAASFGGPNMFAAAGKLAEPIKLLGKSISNPLGAVSNLASKSAPKMTKLLSGKPAQYLLGEATNPLKQGVRVGALAATDGQDDAAVQGAVTSGLGALLKLPASAVRNLHQAAGNIAGGVAQRFSDDVTEPVLKKAASYMQKLKDSTGVDLPLGMAAGKVQKVGGEAKFLPNATIKNYTDVVSKYPDMQKPIQEASNKFEGQASDYIGAGLAKEDALFKAAANKKLRYNSTEISGNKAYKGAIEDVLSSKDWKEVNGKVRNYIEAQGWNKQTIGFWNEVRKTLRDSGSKGQASSNMIDDNAAKFVTAKLEQDPVFAAAMKQGREVRGNREVLQEYAKEFEKTIKAAGVGERKGLMHDLGEGNLLGGSLRLFLRPAIGGVKSALLSSPRYTADISEIAKNRGASDKLQKLLLSDKAGVDKLVTTSAKGRQYNKDERRLLQQILTGSVTANKENK